MSTNLMGTTPANAKLIPMIGDDPWKDSPFFACGMEEDSEHKKAWPVDGTLVGVFHGLRTSNKNGPVKDQRQYAILETASGEKFRAQAPGQLGHALANLEVGKVTVSITYKGKEYVEKLKTECHQFEINKVSIN